MDDKMIKCPSCGEQIPSGSENCPECGAPVGVLEGNVAAGTPIDNTAAINEMLQNSSALVEESGSLGIGSLDSPDDDDSEGEDEFHPSAGGTPPDTLSAEQQKALQAGGVVELKPSTPDLTPHPVKKGKKASKADKGAKNDQSDNGAAPAAAPPPIPGIPGIPGIPAPIVIEESTPQIFEVDEKEENKKRHGKKKSSFLSTFIAVVLALVIGVGAGFFGKMFFMPEIKVPSCQSFAQESAESVLRAIAGSKSNFYVLNAYVKEGTVAKQCLIRAVYDDEENPVPKWYRVKIENSNEQAVHVYMQLDPEEYETLKNSDQEGDRIKAAMLSSIWEETERCITEVNGGLWTEASAASINNTLNPLK